MLYSVDSGKVIDQIPYRQDYNRWRGRLSDEEFENIMTELNRTIDSDTIHTSSWIPGSNWEGTVYDPIYKKACLRNVTESGKCFGLFLWVAMMQREEQWAFGRYELNNIPIEGLTYFRIEIPLRELNN